MPAYNDTPLANDRISDTQPEIRTNFQTIETAFNENHEDLTTATGTAGKHAKVDFTRQSAPLPTSAATDILLYAALGAASTESELFVQKQNGGALYNITEIRTGAGGRMVQLPSGIKLQFGNGTTGAGGNITINYSVAFTTAIYSVLVNATPLTPEAIFANSRGHNLGNFTAYTWTSAGAAAPNRGFYWLAIGI